VFVAVTGFGSVWRRKVGKEHCSSTSFAGPVYYNTSGIIVKGMLRQRPKICGYLRFDTIGGFDPHHPLRMIHRVFECADPSIWNGCNQLLFKRIVGDQSPDRYLVVVRSDVNGRLRVGEENWRSPESWLIAFSECAGQQEALMLLGSNDWITTDVGKFVLKTSEQRPSEARLVLCAAEE
jgi:hypothetical protein